VNEEQTLTLKTPLPPMLNTIERCMRGGEKSRGRVGKTEGAVSEQRGGGARTTRRVEASEKKGGTNGGHLKRGGGVMDGGV